MLKSVIAFVLLSAALGAQSPRLDYYLPQVGDHDASIPKPADLLGFEVGEWHLRPDQIVDYAKALASSSERVSFRVYGRTHEHRPLVLLTISSPENLRRLDQIQAERHALFDPEASAPDLEAMPLVAYMGYSVHGDESSGASAALLFAYHLAASRDQAVEALLANTIVLLDPCLNPDGLGRFALWANGNRGRRINDDPRHREHEQAWPGGRSNHYGFDLNRDWLLARQPESRARLAFFQAWRPNLVADFHEMGTNSTYFFQPGVRSRMNPLIPARNFELTAAIAAANAEALDRLGSLYYTQETFDDFYFGKGSTYPDVHGGVGILFEQASSRGHAQRTAIGRIDFPFTIRNQLTTSIATLDAAFARRSALLAYQRDFYVSALDAATADPTRAWVFHAPEDPARAESLVELLLLHGIAVHRLGQDLKEGAAVFSAGAAFVVPADQPQYRLLKSLFEERREFNDPVFYDVSTWNVLASFDLPHLELDGRRMTPELLGQRLRAEDLPERANSAGTLRRLEGADPYAFVFSWNAASSAALAGALQDQGLTIMAAGEPLQVATAAGPRRFERGSIVVPVGPQKIAASISGLRTLIEAAAVAAGVEVFETATGLTAEGVDFGSPSLRVLKPLRLALLAGSGCSTSEVGHLWHLLDHELGLTVTLLDGDSLGAAALADYSHLIAVSGSEGALARNKDALSAWLRGGGVLVSQRGAAHWAGRELLAIEEPKGAPAPTSAAPKIYADREAKQAENRISGAIFAAEVDITHPLCWGLVRDHIALWHSGTRVLLAPRNALDAPLRFRTEPAPLVSGFASATNVGKLAGSTAASAERLGRGLVVRFADELAFRGIWPGSARIFVNALFMAPLVENTSVGAEAEEAH